MLTHAGSLAGTTPMSAEEQTQYKDAHERIVKLRGDIVAICQRATAVGPKPPPGTFARLAGGMGSNHLGGVPCDLDAHNPAKAGGNSWCVCRKSHAAFNPCHEPTQDCIDAAVKASGQGTVVL
jgi:hypothetical protein